MAEASSDNSSNEPRFELGFGSKFKRSKDRLINKDGTFNVHRTGPVYQQLNIYQWLVTMPWPGFFAATILFYTGINVVFAIGFVLIGVDQLTGDLGETFWEQLASCFFFSVQTFTTVGYGAISPVGFWANMLASFVALGGLLGLALGTGLLFARFSRPTANILFSEKALIAPLKNGTSFQFRIVNQRRNQLIDMSAKVIYTWLEEVDGEYRRRFTQLPLVIDKVVLFPLNWTLVHPIDENSPLYGKTHADYERLESEFLIAIRAYDDTFAQQVIAHSSYRFDDMVCGARFRPMYHKDEEGEIVLELEKLNDYERVDEFGK